MAKKTGAATVSETAASVDRMDALMGSMAGQFSDLDGQWGYASWPANEARDELGAGLGVLFRRNESGRLVVAGVVLLGEAITAADLRLVPLAAIESSRNLSAGVANLPPLRRDPGMTPEAFSQLVAEHYRAWAAVTPRPAAAMAKENGLKLPTIHGWVREARLRGLLPAGNRSKREG